jgi:hypothetical protein
MGQVLEQAAQVWVYTLYPNFVIILYYKLLVFIVEMSE